MRRAVADRARGLLWWSGGIVALVLFTVALFPSIEGNADFDRLADDLPEAMRSLFSFDDAVPLTSAPGYLQTRLFGSLLPVLLLVFAIGAAARVTGGSEEDGTLELLLVHPVTRRRVVAERYAAVVAMVLGLTVVTTASVLVLALPFGALDGVSVLGAATACAATGLLAMVHASVAFAVGAITGRRAPAVAIASAIAVAGYLVDGLASVADPLDPFRFLSPWHWMLSRNMLADGAALAPVVLPVVVSLIVALTGAFGFERRDLR